MSPALDGGEDGVGGFGPDEWFGLVVGLGDEAVDGGLELDDRGEDTALEALPGEPGKPTFDGVGPRTRSRREVCKNRSKPAPDFGRKRQVISVESGR